VERGRIGRAGGEGGGEGDGLHMEGVGGNRGKTEVGGEMEEGKKGGGGGEGGGE